MTDTAQIKEGEKKMTFPAYYQLWDGQEVMSEPTVVNTQVELDAMQERAKEATDGNLWYVRS
jgi:hypothetical protein